MLYIYLGLIFCSVFIETDMWMLAYKRMEI